MLLIEFISHLLNNDIDSYMRYKILGEHKCPPKEIMNERIQCFRCIDCINHCLKQVEFKNDVYKSLGQEFTRDEVEEFLENNPIPDYKTARQNLNK